MHGRIQRGGTGGPDPPLPKNHKNIGFVCNTSPGSPEKSQSCQVSNQCWAIIGPPAKRHLNGVLRFAGGPVMANLLRYLDPLSPHQLKRKNKKEKQKKIPYQIWTPLTYLSGSAHGLFGHPIKQSAILLPKDACPKICLTFDNDVKFTQMFPSITFTSCVICICKARSCYDQWFMRGIYIKLHYLTVELVLGSRLYET